MKLRVRPHSRIYSSPVPSMPVTSSASGCLQVLTRLDARDLARLGATCRTFREPATGGLTLMEAAAAEVLRVRAPWLYQGRNSGETWLGLLRFEEAARAVGLPGISAGEHATAVVALDGTLHVWGPVIDVGGGGGSGGGGGGGNGGGSGCANGGGGSGGGGGGGSNSGGGGSGGGGGGGGRGGLATARVLTAAAGHAFNAGAGLAGSQVVIRRNVVGVVRAGAAAVAAAAAAAVAAAAAAAVTADAAMAAAAAVAAAEAEAAAAAAAGAGAGEVEGAGVGEGTGPEPGTGTGTGSSTGVGPWSGLSGLGPGVGIGLGAGPGAGAVGTPPRPPPPPGSSFTPNSASPGGGGGSPGGGRAWRTLLVTQIKPFKSRNEGSNCV